MNAADLLGKSDVLPPPKKKNKDISIVDRFDEILDICPRTRIVRKFIKEWLEDIETNKIQEDYDNLF